MCVCVCVCVCLLVLVQSVIVWVYASVHIRMCMSLCACSACVGCRDISNNTAICALVTQHVAMLSGWNDGPIHPSVVRTTRPTIKQNRIRRSYIEVAMSSDTSLPFCHCTRAFVLTALTVLHHSFNLLLLQLLRSSLSTTSCKEIGTLQHCVVV